jgi:hypothetical protein
LRIMRNLRGKAGYMSNPVASGNVTPGGYRPSFVQFFDKNSFFSGFTIEEAVLCVKGILTQRIVWANDAGPTHPEASPCTFYFGMGVCQNLVIQRNRQEVLTSFRTDHSPTLLIGNLCFLNDIIVKDL